jgi:PilZ domain
VAETATVRRRSRQKQPTWMPRARRLRLNIPVRYRGRNLSTWYEGMIQNISQSGVLFHGPQELPVNALAELIFEMPELISGQKNSNVLCQGRLIRIKDAADNVEDAFAMAASILDYKFLHQD